MSKTTNKQRYNQLTEWLLTLKKNKDTTTESRGPRKKFSNNRSYKNSRR